MINLEEYGFRPDMVPNGASGVPARVTAVHKERVALALAHGECFGRLKASVYYAGGMGEYPTTGDFVLTNYNPMGDSQILATLPRKSCFSRREPGPIPREQAIAANFDYVFIMQSLNHDFNLKRLDRYLTLAWQSGAMPVVLLTKADLAEDYQEQLRLAQNAAAGVSIFAVSAHTGFGLDALGEYLKPRKTIVFLGSSGVGKSSLLNALARSAGHTEEIMAVREIREDDSRGRHTTTHRQLIMLNSGAMIIDTPGMRELGMWDVTSGLGETFSDVEQYFEECRFSDCKHQAEPGCAIRTAIESGALPQARWESYLRLRREARFTGDKMGALQDKWRRNKEIAKASRQRKSEERRKPN